MLGLSSPFDARTEFSELLNSRSCFTTFSVCTSHSAYSQISLNFLVTISRASFNWQQALLTHKEKFHNIQRHCAHISYFQHKILLILNLPSSEHWCIGTGVHIAISSNDPQWHLLFWTFLLYSLYSVKSRILAFSSPAPNSSDLHGLRDGRPCCGPHTPQLSGYKRSFTHTSSAKTWTFGAEQHHRRSNLENL